MLDTATKRRIDDCRDILVGKLPDPKAQIEQITIGLIYKFMDDMDKEAVELGGKAKFFSNYSIPDPKDMDKQLVVEFEKYSWDNLFDAKVTATEMLTLYAEAIAGMDKNPNIPQLFRDIFKNAYLPYRDPETLKMFLKTINEFEYSHSEKLGDAFEYLLSVMGSQGDAGQFRTPRHIIDFLVAAVNPGKTDTILDPACGTAGFLISAFKHIKEQNNNELTPDERKKLIQNFVGYDISPDMVRLSLVNLYLHGFSAPHIWEYDTLSSEERWTENFDVVLANPPFMSPKGGIRPHKKFSIASNRSEVLFVDYIAEHLNPKGRAGIIVPEGVIFQSGTAYKDLRKMLVDNYLYAVISLPAGVFNPYSGVKTSILLLDKELAKTNDNILFVKVENDGYGLGAQRNAVKGGQLEDAIEVLNQFKAGTFSESEIAHIVQKSVIAEKGDYNLSGERYKTNVVISSKYAFCKLSDICDINPENIEPSNLNTDEFIYVDISSVENGTGRIKYDNFVKSEDAPSRARRKIQNKDVLLSTVRPNLKAFGYVENPPLNTIASTGFALLRTSECLNPKFLFYNLFTDQIVNQMISMMGKGAYPSINQADVSSLQIPLPPLSVQEKIVAEIEGYQKIIDGAKMVVEHYKPKIDIDPEWEMVELGKHCKIKGGNAFKSTDYVSEGAQLIRMGNVKQMFFDVNNSPTFLPKNFLKSNPKFIIEKGDLLISMTGTIGKEDYGNVCQIDIDELFLLNQRVGKFEIDSNYLLREYIYYFANSDNFRKQLFANSSGGVRQSNISNKGIEEIIIPLPSLDIQSQIVTRIEKEQSLVNANNELIAIFEQKIKDRIGKVWGEKTAASAPNPAPKSPKGDLESADKEMLMAAEPVVKYGKK